METQEVVHITFTGSGPTVRLVPPERVQQRVVQQIGNSPSCHVLDASVVRVKSEERFVSQERVRLDRPTDCEGAIFTRVEEHFSQCAVSKKS